MKQRLDEGEFLEQRQGVLATWSTGGEVDFDEAVSYHSKLPLNKRFPQVLDEARDSGQILTQPRAGVALLENHIMLLEYLRREGGAELLPTTIDSYTRQNRYADAQRGIEESLREGRSLLNGFPAVNLGIAACRRIIETLDVPVQVRHGTPDARLLAEITIAGGFSAFEGGGISYNIPYAKDVPLEKSVKDWQYVDRLVGWYQEHGVTVNREPFGPLTGTMVLPCISNAVAVIEALLAAEQGVTHITLGYGQCGNLIQDVAAVQSLKKLSEEYLARFGYSSISLSTVFHQWMGGFPQDEARAYGVISWGAVAAALAKVTKVIVKTPHEAVGIPTKEANAAGLKTTRQVLRMLQDQTLPETDDLIEEREVISAETRALIDCTLELGEGHLATGVVRAFKAGVLDIPFAPSRHNAGKVMPARDDSGGVRLLEFGNLPLPASAVARHRAKLDERARKEGRNAGFQMVIDDIYAISKGMLVGRPR